MTSAGAPTPAGRIETLLLAVAAALPLALWDTSWHVVPTSAGPWRGVSDAPGAARIVVALLAGLLLALLLRHRAPRVRRPFLALALAGTPLVPVLFGGPSALLVFQGPVLVVLLAVVSSAAIAAGGVWREPRPAVLFLVAFAFYAVLGTRLPGPAGPQGDEPHYLAMTVSLLTDGDLDLTDEFAGREYAPFFAGTLEPHRSPASPPGRLRSLHAPGLPALVLPAYAIAGYSGARLFVSAIAALTGALAFVLVQGALKRPGPALGAWLILTLTPPLPFYAVSIYPETPAALATAVFLLATRRDPRLGLTLAAAASAALLPWLHPKLLPLAALGLALTLARRMPWARRAVALAVFLGSIGALLVFFKAGYGRAALSAAYGPGFASDVSASRVPWGLAGLLFDRQFGLLAASPVWALALPGSVLLLRARAGDGLRALLLGASSALVGAAFSMWWGGACPPARFLVPALPALALALAPALTARPALSGGLAGFGLAVVALAAEAPRALHNRADGESALLRHLSPAVDLDPSLPSFVGAGGDAPVLALTLAVALVLLWARGPRGFALGAVAYGALSSGARDRPWVDERQATLRVLGVWDDARLQPPPALSTLSIPLDLPEAPWRLDASEIRNSRRLDLPPGLYRIEVRGRVVEALATAHVVRLDLTAGELLLARTYLREGQPPPVLPLLLPAGARRLMLTAAGVQGIGLLEEVRLVPEDLVPARRRDDYPWPRLPTEDRYRVGTGPVKLTALDRSAPEAAGFRLDGPEGLFLVEAPLGEELWLTLSRPRPSADDAVWVGDRRLTFGGSPSVRLSLDTSRGVSLGGTAVVPLRVRSADARVDLSPAP
jgi:hypothetical protein